MMFLIYIDDSRDHDIRLTTFSAIAIPVAVWADVFAALREWRRTLRDSDGILVTKELHAWKFVSGRGNLGSKIVTKYRRSVIFRDGLSLLATQKVRVFNVCMRREQYAFERLLNRINRTMREWKSYAVLICDEGKEASYTRLVRKMSVYNPIPSQYGIWAETKKGYRNIPIDRILEDPFFKSSDRSYFIQMADWCAYSLLQRERPIESRKRYQLHTAFDLLRPICFLDANKRDPFGIVRD